MDIFLFYIFLAQRCHNLGLSTPTIKLILLIQKWVVYYFDTTTKLSPAPTLNFVVYVIGFLNALKIRTYYAIKRDYEKMWLKFDGLINIKIVFWFCLSRLVYISTLIFIAEKYICTRWMYDHKKFSTCIKYIRFIVYIRDEIGLK